MTGLMPYGTPNTAPHMQEIGWYQVAHVQVTTTVFKHTPTTQKLGPELMVPQKAPPQYMFKPFMEVRRIDESMQAFTLVFAIIKYIYITSE